MWRLISFYYSKLHGTPTQVMASKRMEFGTGILPYPLTSGVSWGNTSRVANSFQFAQDFPDFNTEHPESLETPQSWENWDSWSSCTRFPNQLLVPIEIRRRLLRSQVINPHNILLGVCNFLLITVEESEPREAQTTAQGGLAMKWYLKPYVSLRCMIFPLHRTSGNTSWPEEPL